MFLLLLSPTAEIEFPDRKLFCYLVEMELKPKLNSGCKMLIYERFDLNSVLISYLYTLDNTLFNSHM